MSLQCTLFRLHTIPSEKRVGLDLKRLFLLLVSDFNCDFNGARCIVQISTGGGPIHGRTDGHGGLSGRTFLTSDS